MDGYTVRLVNLDGSRETITYDDQMSFMFYLDIFRDDGYKVYYYGTNALVMEA